MSASPPACAASRQWPERTIQARASSASRGTAFVSFDAHRDGDFAPYRAHEAQGDERTRLWSLANELYPGYDTYQGRAGERRIPVLVLEPAQAGRTETS